MASLLNCTLSSLVARTTASTVRQRSMATLPFAPSKATNAAVKGAVKGEGAATPHSSPSSASSTRPPNTNANAAAPEAEENVLKTLWNNHKHQRVAIVTVLVAAATAESAFWYFSYFKDRNKGEAIEEKLSTVEK